jgi:BirA family biotin operon repressor/biotin-[acetyl-CoA-carboxylase] ligase
MGYEPLDKTEIYKALNELSHSLAQLEILTNIDSTNNYLCKKRHFKGRYAVLAEQQTAGRGRIGHQWRSPPGNLYLSLLCHHTGALHSLSQLYQLSGQAVLDALQAIGLEGAYLELPNDIFYHNKKLGGILIELFPSDTASYDIIIGIGLNLYPLPEKEAAYIDQPWTALYRINPDLSKVRNKIAGFVLKFLLQAVNTL